jgi:putative hydrolase of the HAD superfamily
MAIKNIIFDYGNVIFSIDFKRVQQALKDIGIADTDSFYGHLQQNSVFDDFEQGLISPATFRDHVREKANNPDLTDEQIDHAWNAILIGVAEGNHELLMELKPKYRTFLLSNTNAIHYDYIHNYLDQEFGLAGNDSMFEKVYYSHLMKKRKPNVEIFEQVLEENNLNPDETLFIDDSPQHIEGAKKAGLHTYLLKAPETIQDFFAKGMLE